MKKKRKKNRKTRPKKRQSPMLQSSHRSTNVERTSNLSIDEAVVAKLNVEFHRSSPCLTSMAWGLVPDELVETS